jgi:hypothetical protein
MELARGIRPGRGQAMNPLGPDLVFSKERIGKVAKLSVAGLMLLRAQQSSPLYAHSEESSLDRAAAMSADARAWKVGRVRMCCRASDLADVQLRERRQ